MICYHGSYCKINKPSILFSREKLDFGKGFYITPIEEQANSWVSRFKRIGKPGIVNVYELDYEAVINKYKDLDRKSVV